MNLDIILNRNFTNISAKYEKFAKKKSNCRKCGLFNHYKQVAQSEGNAVNPIFMFIGEGYGKDEVSQIRPFIGRAGKRIRSEIRKHPDTFNKKTCLLSNVLSCRPLNNKFPKGIGDWCDNSKALSGDDLVISCAERWLFQEIELVNPKVLVLLGSQSLRFMRNQTGITDNRGSWKFLPQFKAWSFATYHPSYVLRCEQSKKRFVVRQFEDDIKKIAKTWRSIIENDYRMSMSKEEWVRTQNMMSIVNMSRSKDDNYEEYEWMDET